MNAFRRQRKRAKEGVNAYVVHEEDLVVASLGVLGVDGDDELVAGLDGDLETKRS